MKYCKSTFKPQPQPHVLNIIKMEGKTDSGSGNNAYKLTYFNIRARGEAIRMMMTFAGQPFEDDRIELEEWFPKLKSGKRNNHNMHV